MFTGKALPNGFFGSDSNIPPCTIGHLLHRESQLPQENYRQHCPSVGISDIMFSLHDANLYNNTTRIWVHIILRISRDDSPYSSCVVGVRSVVCSQKRYRVLDDSSETIGIIDQGHRWYMDLLIVVILAVVVLVVVVLVAVVLVVINSRRRGEEEDPTPQPPNLWFWIEINGTPVREVSLGEGDSFNVIDAGGNSINVPFTRGGSGSATFPITAISPAGAVIVPFSVLIPGGRYRKYDGSPISLDEVQACQNGSSLCYQTQVSLQYCSRLSNPFSVDDPCFNFPTSISSEKRIRFCGPSALGSGNISKQCRQSDGSLVNEGITEEFFDVIDNDCGLSTQVIVTNAGGNTGYIFFDKDSTQGLVYNTQPTFNLLPMPFAIVGVKLGCSVNAGYAMRIFLPTLDAYLTSNSTVERDDQSLRWIIYNASDTSGVFMQSSTNYTLASMSELVDLLQDVADEMKALPASSSLISLRTSLEGFIFNATNVAIGVPPPTLESALSTLSQLLLGTSTVDQSGLVIAISQIVADVEGAYPLIASRLLLVQQFLESIVPASLPFIDGSAIYNFTGTLSDLQTISLTRESLWEFFSNPDSLVLSYDAVPTLKTVSTLLSESPQPFSMSFRSFNML